MKCFSRMVVLVFMVLAMMMVSPGLRAQGTVTMKKSVLLDKIKGGWAGQVIGCALGGPTEFCYRGTMIPDSRVLEYPEGHVRYFYEKVPTLYDDIYMDLTFVDVYDRLGLDAPAEELARAYAYADYNLWHANMLGRFNVKHNIMPPLSGHWLNNPHADCIDFQIEADFAGLMSPGMVNTSSGICDKVGHIMNYGDGWYGGVYVGAMYALAFVEDDVETVVEEALKVIPQQSKFYRCICDVINWYKADPTDWKKCWQLYNDKYSEDVGCPELVLEAGNIDATMNCAYVVMGLLYGKGDFKQTMEISCRCGQDSDCNPATAAGILATMLGYSGIPEFWMPNLRDCEDLTFAYTSMSLNKTYEVCNRLAIEEILANGGSQTDDEVTIKVQVPEPVRFEESFPGYVPHLLAANVSNIGTERASMRACKFDGVGIAFHGSLQAPSTSYVAHLDCYVDGKFDRRMTLQTDYRKRTDVIYWKYGLEEGEHVVTFNLVNPQEGVVLSSDKVIYYTLNSNWAFVNQKGYEPERLLRFNLDYDRCSELMLSAGVSQDTAALKPQYEINMLECSGAQTKAKAWKDGVYAEPQEFLYDISKVGEGIDYSKPLKFFFIIKSIASGQGKGHLNGASVLSYQYDKQNPMEVPFKVDTLELSGGMATLMLTAVLPTENLAVPLNLELDGTKLSWTRPQAVSLPLRKYYVYLNGELQDSVAANKTETEVSDAEGVYTLRALYAYRDKLLLSEPSNPAANALLLGAGDNEVLALSDCGLLVPSAVSKRLDKATIEFMIKPTTLGGTYNKFGGSQGGFFLNITATGQVQAGWSTATVNDYVSTGTGVLKANKWAHVAVVVDGSTLSIYIDGMKKKSVTSKTYRGLPQLGDFCIGTDEGPMNAQIDEFRLWGCARQMGEIYGGKDERVANPSGWADLLVYLPMETIDDVGELKVRDYALGHHAVFSNNNREQKVDNSILQGAKVAGSVSIGYEADSLATGVATRFVASSPLSTVAWRWETVGAQRPSCSSQAPYLIYNNAGEYTMTLTAKLADGVVKVAEKQITVKPAMVTEVDFYASALKGTTGEPLSFINLSKGLGASYVWNLAGARTQTLSATNATAVYDVPGIYTVTLTATNASGSQSLSQQIEIEGEPTAVVALLNDADALMVKAVKGGLRLSAQKKQRAVVFDALGRVVFSGMVEGYCMVPLEKGIYLVSNKKVMVR